MNQEGKLHQMFAVLVEEHAPMLVTYLASLTGSRDEAEDLAQEAFLRAFQKFDRFSGGTAGFTAWLRTIGKNVMLDRYRRSRKTILVNESILEGIEEVFLAADKCGTGDTWSDRVSSLKECLGSLSATLADVCTLYYFEGLRTRDIAKRFRIKAQTVLKRLERARSFLRQCIDRKLGLEAIGAEHDS